MHTFVTTTSYGSWLPGDARGWIREGRLLPEHPWTEKQARERLKKEPVTFSTTEQATL